MCGISGFVAKKNEYIKNSILLDMNNLIHHRGPDDEGFIFLSNNKKLITAGGNSTPSEVWKKNTNYKPIININGICDGYASMALGHKRLSILDLSPGGHQPMSYLNDRYWIVFNGEIYNYRDIKFELEIIGHHFSTRTDTEIVLAAYSEWGEACLNRFVGMWAFAIYDKDKNEIFLSRDRYGIKPFYYFFSSKGDLYFASEIKQFTTLGCWQAKMNSARIYDQLVYSLTDHTDETMFAGVFQLPGGTFYKASLDSIKPDLTGKLKYKHWYCQKNDPFKGDFSEAAATFRNLFERAVKEHLYADVPVGTALSGGLDSSSIVCEINRILNKDGIAGLQKTFSSCSEYKRYSEKNWMDIVIDYTKVDASFVFPRLEDVFIITPHLIWYHDEPYQSQSAFLAYHVFKQARSNNVKVLLNGQGADEYLGGYGQFTISRYAHIVKRFQFITLLKDVNNLVRNYPFSYMHIFINVLFYLLPSSLKRGLTKIKSSTDSIKHVIDTKRLNLKPVHPYDIIPVGNSTVQEIAENQTFYSSLPKYLHWEDRNSMANSIEARVPFLDHRLVEFSSNLPDDFLEKDGVNKRIMREAMIGLIPEKILKRKDKMGFTTPEEVWVKKEAPELFKKKISESILVTDGIIKPVALKYFDDIVKDKLPFNYAYWRLILFAEWIKKFNVRI